MRSRSASAAACSLSAHCSDCSRSATFCSMRRRRRMCSRPKWRNRLATAFAWPSLSSAWMACGKRPEAGSRRVVQPRAQPRPDLCTPHTCAHLHCRAVFHLREEALHQLLGDAAVAREHEGHGLKEKRRIHAARRLVAPLQLLNQLRAVGAKDRRLCVVLGTCEQGQGAGSGVAALLPTHG